jgi:hypothetical protein
MKEPRQITKQNATRDFDKEFQDIDQVFIPIFKSDDSLIDYAQKLIYNNNSKITILDVKGHAKNNFVFKVL